DFASVLVEVMEEAELCRCEVKRCAAEREKHSALVIVQTGYRDDGRVWVNETQDGRGCAQPNQIAVTQHMRDIETLAVEKCAIGAPRIDQLIARPYALDLGVEP